MAASGIDLDYVDRRFRQFLDTALPSSRLDQMRSRGETRFVVDLDRLRQFDASFERDLVRRASEYLPRLHDALNSYASSSSSDSPSEKPGDTSESAQGTTNAMTLGFAGSFGANQLTPRTLRSQHLWSLISVEGMVTKSSAVHPKVVRSAHYCEKTKEVVERSYADEASAYSGAAGTAALLAHVASTAAFPTQDPAGNPLTTEYGHCVFRDTQTLVLQEMPECAPAGQLPRSVNVAVEGDLVDRAKPGDRVQVVGVYCAMPQAVTRKGTSGTFKTVLVSNNVTKIMRDASQPQFTEVDVANIKAVSRLPDIYDRLSASLAPSIFGHQAVKRALLLQLMGGQEKITKAGMHLRGDINVLLVGDPSTAKSQLLRYMLHVAPLAVSTNARGASGVGLTAAVVMDQETHERTLEAGAMVLADRGVVCIDEFDKMNPDDRAALHEVMEQQTVTIQKAGVHASLNARCSVLAAANPIYGSYNREKSVMQNIGLPATLLSRFDVLFIVLDPADPTHDRTIAEHVVKMHRDGNRVASSESDMANARRNNLVSLEDFCKRFAAAGGGGSSGAGSDEATPIFAHSEVTGITSQEELRAVSASEPFSVSFLRKYILFAKHTVKPVLTPEASEVLVESFVDFRARASQTTAVSSTAPGGNGATWQHKRHGTLPVTARLLESLVRLSEARARCRLSPTVSVEDARAAVALVSNALYNEGTGAPEEETVGPTSIPGPLSADGSGDSSRKRTRDDVDQAEVTEAVRTSLLALLRTSTVVPLEDVSEHLDGRYSLAQVESAIRTLQDAKSNFVYSEGTVFRT